MDIPFVSYCLLLNTRNPPRISRVIFYLLASPFEAPTYRRDEVGLVLLVCLLTNLIFGFAYNFHIKFSMFFRRLSCLFSALPFVALREVGRINSNRPPSFRIRETSAAKAGAMVKRVYACMFYSQPR